MKEPESVTENASIEQVKEAKRLAEELLEHPLPISHDLPEIALFGYKEKATGQYWLLKEIRVYETKALFQEDSQKDGMIRLFALRKKMVLMLQNLMRMRKKSSSRLFSHSAMKRWIFISVITRLHERRIHKPCEPIPASSLCVDSIFSQTDCIPSVFAEGFSQKNRHA